MLRRRSSASPGRRRTSVILQVPARAELVALKIGPCFPAVTSPGQNPSLPPISRVRPTL